MFKNLNVKHSLKISVVTLFPQMFQGPFDHSIVKLAKENGKVEINLVDLRDFGIGKHKTVDDTPYGGGIGMVLRVDVVKKAIDSVRTNSKHEKVILMSARGKPFVQQTANDYSKLDSLIIICGHYEGIDERIHDYIDEEVSVGDFVTTGGEIPAMAITDAVTRLIPGVLKEGATDNESFSLRDNENTLLEYPHYTRPPEFEGKSVPEILTSGNHKEIEKWRMQEAKKVTKLRRKDLLKK